MILFDQIKILTYKAPQNDCLELSFVKDFHADGKKMTRYGGKMAIYESKILSFFSSKIAKKMK